MKRYIGVADRYEIIDLIGKGGMGEVYRVSDRFNNDSPAALKIISSDIKIPNTKLLKNEFLLLSMLAHPNLIKVYELGFYSREMQYIYYTMEYIDQKNLDAVLPLLDKIQKVEIIKLILHTLLYIHSRGILHLDMKPKNILIPPEKSMNRLKIIDFGLSELKINSQNLNTSKGSLAFIAPEVLAREKGIDERADLFSLGALILRMYSQKMFRLYAMKDQSIKGLLVRHIPPKLVKFVEKLLYINRNNRFQKTAEALNYFMDLMNLSPYVLSKDDYIDILSRNPQYSLDERIKRVLDAIELKNARKILVYGINGTGKTRFLKELELHLRMKNYKTFFIGKGINSSFKYNLISELSMQGIITAEEKEAIDSEISNLIRGYSSSQIANLKKIIAYKLADFLEDKLNDAVLLVDDLNLIHKHEGDIIKHMLPLPGLYMSAVMTRSRSKPLRGYDLSICMKNLSQQETGKFVSLCLGLRDINPKSVSEISVSTGGNPKKIKDYLYASLSRGFNDTSEGLVLSMPAEIKVQKEIDLHDSILDFRLKRLLPEEQLILFILDKFPAPLDIREIKVISGKDGRDVEYALKKMQKLGLVDNIQDKFSSAYPVPESCHEKNISKASMKDMFVKMSGFISDKPDDYNPYKIMYIYNGINSPSAGFEQILKIAVRLYRSGNPYNSLDVLNYLIKEYRKNKPDSTPDNIYFNIITPTRYFEKPIEFSLLNLGLLKAELLRFTGSYRASNRLLMRLLKEKPGNEAKWNIKYNIARNHVNLHDFEEALIVLDEIMAEIDDIDNIYFFQSVSQKCWIYIQRGNLDKCESLLSSFYKVIDDMPSTLKMIQSAIYYSRAKYDDAIKVLLEICSEKSRLIDNNTLSKVYNNLGILYKLKNRFDKSKEFFKKSYEIKKAMGDYESLAKTYNNMGSIYLSEYDLNTAYTYYKKALKSAEFVGDRASTMSASINVANLYIMFGDPYQALNQLNKILPGAISENDQDILFHIYINALDAMILQNKISRAYYYLGLISEIAENTNKELFFFHHKINLFYLSMISLDLKTARAALSELSNDPSIRQLSGIFSRFTAMLLDFTMLRSLTVPDFEKYASEMTERYLNLYAKNDNINNLLIKYSLCLLIMTGKSRALMKADEKESHILLKKNRKLYDTMAELYSMRNSDDAGRPFLLFHKAARSMDGEREKLSLSISSVLKLLSELDHIYITVLPFIYYKLYVFCRDRGFMQEAERIKSIIAAIADKRISVHSEEKRDQIKKSSLFSLLADLKS